MQILLKNESDICIWVKLNGREYRLIPHEGKYAELENEKSELIVCPDEQYRCEPITGKMGLNYFHRFVVQAKYEFTPDSCNTIRFYSETAQGNNFESYKRVYPFCDGCKFSVPVYCVKDEGTIKERIEKSDKKETVILQGAFVAGKLIKAKNTFDDIVAGLIIGVIAIVIFALVWIFKDFRTAALTYAVAAAVGFLLWKLFFEKIIKKAKSKAKKKVEEKFGKAFLPCENMPEGIFKGKDSYFCSDYISAVFKYSTKRK